MVGTSTAVGATRVRAQAAAAEETRKTQFHAATLGLEPRARIRGTTRTPAP